MKRHQRRAYNSDGTIIPPMDLANMRENGVRSVLATCNTCQHEATVNVDALPATLPVPDVGLKLKCSACGGKDINTRPAWEKPKTKW